MKIPLLLCRGGLGLIWHRAPVRCVSTLSPLGSAFNTLPPRKRRAKFTQANVGLFCIPELTDYTKFKVLEEKLIDQVQGLVEEICNPKRTRKMVFIFDELSDCICRVADMADFVRMSHPQDHYKEAAEEICMKMGQIVETLNTDVDIHRALQNVIMNGDIVEMTDVDQRVGELFMFDFEQSGIHLEEEQMDALSRLKVKQNTSKLLSGFLLTWHIVPRYQFIRINESIMRIGNQFVQSTVRPIQYAESIDLPKNHEMFASEGGKLLLKGLHSENYDEKIREAAYRVYLHPSPEQNGLLDDLLSGRRLLANLVGFPTWAHRALKGTTAESPENVMKLLEVVSANIKAGAKADYDTMRSIKAEIKQSSPFTVTNDEVMAWDPVFCTNHARQLTCNAENVMDYFSLGRCMEGLNNLFKCLYNVTLENVTPSNGEIWHSEVYKLAIVHETEGILGYIYCDFYAQMGKLQQDCHFTIQGGRMKANGEYQLPIVVLQLNFNKPGTFIPTLLWPGQVENLFHEFGHAMHSMLGRTRYQHVTGTRCPIDFAEVPSVLMEYFASDPRVVKSFAKHYKTGQALDSGMLRGYCRAKRLFLYSETQLQVFYAILDQVYHGPDFSPKSTTDILQEVQEQHYGLPYVDRTAWQHRFGHLVGYGGRYYSYLMARAIASKIWREFFKADPFNRENGEKYRRTVLAHGGERNPMELLEDLFGEKQTFDMLIDSLLEDVETRAIQQTSPGS